jgi:hypothetical protein
LGNKKPRQINWFKFGGVLFVKKLVTNAITATTRATTMTNNHTMATTTADNTMSATMSATSERCVTHGNQTQN